jgi:hypothetical protein
MRLDTSHYIKASATVQHNPFFLLPVLQQSNRA